MRLLPASLAIIAMLVTTAVAHAQPSLTMSGAPPDQVEEERVEERYGGEILLADLAGVTLMVLGVAADSEGVAQVGLAVSAIAPAGIHLAHGNGSAALGSLVLRPGLVALGALGGAATASCTDTEWFCGLAEAAVGGLVGYGAAIAIDAGVLARVTKVTRLRGLAPQIAFDGEGGGRVGLVGTF